MLHRRVPVSLFTVSLAIFALAASALIAGCRSGGRRLTMGGQEAAELVAEDETATPAAPSAQGAGTAAAGGAAGAGRGMRGAGMRGGGMRGGGMRGGGMRGGGMRGGAAQTAAGPAASAPAAPVRERPKLTEVEIAEKVNEFASLFGPVFRVKEEYWDDKTTEWLLFTYTGENRSASGRRIKLPLSMVEDTEDQSILEGYFPIYVVTGLRPSGNVISRQEVSVPTISIEEYKEQYAAKVAAAREAASAEAAEASEAGEAAEGAEVEAAAETPAAGPRRGPGAGPGGRRGRRGR